jgi:exopolyphosphatase/guanosine-5'-triphosphate,3'-diphosphate pyrophosphatase
LGEKCAELPGVSTIIPRWEWRTFGPSFGAAETTLGGLTVRAVDESDELYLLSEDGDNVKVRAELIDIKVLREVDRRGLERWEPVFKAGFPLHASDVAVVFDALRRRVPTLSRSAYSLAQFLEELIEPIGTIRVVPIHKRRVRYTIDGCMAELSDIEVGGRRVRTLALEAEDPAAVVAGVATLGLGDRLNTSVPRGMTALINGESPRYAVIDVGTNSVKFHVGEQTGAGGWRRVVDRAETTRLGDGLAASGVISADALERTTVAIAGMADEARKHHTRSIVAVGTAGLRTASNRDEVVAAIKEVTGVTVDPISGDKESQLAYLAVRTDLESTDGALVVFDTGGGSTQFTFGHGAEVDDRFSVPVGAVRYTERFGLADAVSTDALQAALEAIASDLHVIDARPTADTVVGMGGAVTNITAVKLGLDAYDPDAVQGATLDRAEIDRQIELYRSQDANERRAIVGLQPNRADVILAGACVVRTIMDKLGQDTITVSDRGLRHGLLIERFGSPPR